ncbi:MAG: hypothetical protein ACK56I_37595, partial [bacterium]
GVRGPIDPHAVPHDHEVEHPLRIGMPVGDDLLPRAADRWPTEHHPLQAAVAIERDRHRLLRVVPPGMERPDGRPPRVARPAADAERSRLPLHWLDGRRVGGDREALALGGVHRGGAVLAFPVEPARGLRRPGDRGRHPHVHPGHVGRPER